MIALNQTDSDDSHIDIVGQLRYDLAFQISDSGEVITLIAGALSHQTIRMLSAKIGGIAAYKGLDMVVDNCYRHSDGMFRVLVETVSA